MRPPLEVHSYHKPKRALIQAVYLLYDLLVCTVLVRTGTVVRTYCTVHYLLYLYVCTVTVHIQPCTVRYCEFTVQYSSL